MVELIENSMRQSYSDYAEDLRSIVKQATNWHNSLTNRASSPFQLQASVPPYTYASATSVTVSIGVLHSSSDFDFDPSASGFPLFYLRSFLLCLPFFVPDMSYAPSNSFFRVISKQEYLHLPCGREGRGYKAMYPLLSLSVFSASLQILSGVILDSSASHLASYGHAAFYAATASSQQLGRLDDLRSQATSRSCFHSFHRSEACIDGKNIY